MIPGPVSRLIAIGALLAAVALVLGCAKYGARSQPPVSRILGQTTKPNAISLEIAVCQIDEHQRDALESLWATLDEQKVALEARKRLDQNGIRVTVVPARIPSAMNKLTVDQELDREKLDVWQRQLFDEGKLETASRLVLHRNLECLPAESKSIASSDVRESANWVVRQGNQQSFGSGENVRGVWNFKVHPNSNGSSRIVLTPEIHHGKHRSEIGVAEGGFLFQTRQTIQRLSEMEFDVTLLKGESIIICATEDMTDMGELFFGPTDTSEDVDDSERKGVLSQAKLITEPGSQRILMMRLVAVEMDPAWIDNIDEEPLVTVD